MNYKTLQIQIEEIAQNAVSSTQWIGKHVLKINSKVAFFIEYRRTKGQSIVVTHPSTLYFLLPFFKIFVTHSPKINELDTVVTATPKIWKVH